MYYAGHGIEVRGINYLVPVNAKLASDRDARTKPLHSIASSNRSMRPGGCGSLSSTPAGTIPSSPP